MTGRRSRGSMTLLTRLAKIAYRRSAADGGMTVSLRNFGTLTYLRDHGRVKQSDLADVLHMDANNIVILLNDLEADGFVRRTRDPEDRRRHVVELTEIGETVRERNEAELDRVEASVFAALSAEERRTMHALLEKALAGADDPAAPSRAAAKRARAAAQPA